MKYIILAGGNGSRMTMYSKILPKALLPIYNKPLLMHTIEYIQEADEKATVYLSICQEDTNFFLGFIAKLDKKEKIFLVINPNHSKGILEALFFVLDQYNLGQECTLLLGDIFFLDNPFLDNKKTIKNKNDVLFGYITNSQKQIANGGIGIIDGKDIKQVSKVGLPGISRALMWSGLVYLHGNIYADILSFLNVNVGKKDKSLEDFLQFRLERHGKALYQNERYFININTVDHLFLAACLKYSILHDKSVIPNLEEIKNDMIKKGQQI